MDKNKTDTNNIIINFSFFPFCFRTVSLKEYTNKLESPEQFFDYFSKLFEVTIPALSNLTFDNVYVETKRHSHTISPKDIKEYELDQHIIGYTPILHQPRGIEIQEYLNQLDYQPNFIIIDDDTDMDNLIDYLIKTSISVGLTKENVDEAIKKLIK